METNSIPNGVEIKPPYKPVVLVHGLMTGDVTMLELANQIEEVNLQLFKF